jgi:hypothetical protein
MLLKAGQFLLAPPGSAWLRLLRRFKASDLEAAASILRCFAASKSQLPCALL